MNFSRVIVESFSRGGQNCNPNVRGNILKKSSSVQKLAFLQHFRTLKELIRLFCQKIFVWFVKPALNVSLRRFWCKKNLEKVVFFSSTFRIARKSFGFSSKVIQRVVKPAITPPVFRGENSEKVVFFPINFGGGTENLGLLRKLFQRVVNFAF